MGRGGFNKGKAGSSLFKKMLNSNSLLYWVSNSRHSEAEILLSGCISEPSFYAVHAPLIIQGVHVQRLLVGFFYYTQKNMRHHLCKASCSCTRQLSSFCTEVFQIPSVADSKSTFRKSDGQGLYSWFAVDGCWGCRFSLPLTMALRSCNSVPSDATTGNKFGDRPLLGGNPVNSVCSKPGF